MTVERLANLIYVRTILVLLTTVGLFVVNIIQGTGH